MKNSHLIVITAAAGLAGFAAWRLYSRGISGSAADIGGAAVKAADGLIGGVINGIGDLVGLPRTNKSAGQAAWDGGNYLEASRLLPASDFLGNVWDAIKGSATPANAIDPKLEIAKQNAALYGGTVEGWYGVDYIDNDPVSLRGTSAPIASKWGTQTAVGWPWER